MWLVPTKHKIGWHKQAPTTEKQGTSGKCSKNRCASSVWVGTLRDMKQMKVKIGPDLASSKSRDYLHPFFYAKHVIKVK